MFPNFSGKTLDLKCNEPVIPEFPDMLFGTSIEKGISFFDATIFIQKQHPSVSIDDFFKGCEVQIESLCKVYQIEKNDICQLNTEGHLLINSTFRYLFISFVEPDFLAYMCERIDDLLTTGFCVSDTLIFKLAYSRLSKESLKKIIEDEEI
jgi:hypothetical protein